MPSFIFKFDELPLFKAGPIRCGTIDGEAEVDYGDDGEWMLGTIVIDVAQDGCVGTQSVELRSDNHYVVSPSNRLVPLRLFVVQAIGLELSDAIDARVIDALAEVGVYPGARLRDEAAQDFRAAALSHAGRV